MFRRPLRTARADAGLSKLTLVLGLAGVLVVGGTGALLVAGSDSPLAAVAGSGPTPTPAPTVGVALAGEHGDTVPWERPLTFAVTDGTIETLTATGPDGQPYEGTVTGDRWVGRTTLVPGARYVLHAVVKNRDGRESTVDRTLTAAPATELLHATVSPAGGVFGVGQAVIVRFDHKVSGAAARSAVLRHLRVDTTPAAPGAWRWYNSFEAHYRGPAYWKPGTSISVTAALAGLRVPGTRVWGAAEPVTRTYSIGRAFVATVDVTAHKMTVLIDGKVVRVMNVSTGRAQYPTKGGVHIVLVREKVHLYNSGTVGIPTDGPGGYYEKLPWSTRISNGGAFVHANPATVKYQGRTNVSHGCVNMSVSDAHWFYDNSKLGDIVDVVHAAVGPLRSDAGMSDWNYSWADWSKGNLTG